MIEFLFLSILLLVTIFSPKAQCEVYTFPKLDIYTGLLQKQVNTILQDQKDFLWPGTMSVLNHCDGYACKVYDNRQGDTT